MARIDLRAVFWSTCFGLAACAGGSCNSPTASDSSDAQEQTRAGAVFVSPARVSDCLGRAGLAETSRKFTEGPNVLVSGNSLTVADSSAEFNCCARPTIEARLDDSSTTTIVEVVERNTSAVECNCGYCLFALSVTVHNLPRGVWPVRVYRGKYDAATQALTTKELILATSVTIEGSVCYGLDASECSAHPECVSPNRADCQCTPESAPDDAGCTEDCPPPSCVPDPQASAAACAALDPDSCSANSSCTTVYQGICDCECAEHQAGGGCDGCSSACFVPVCTAAGANSEET